MASAGAVGPTEPTTGDRSVDDRPLAVSLLGVGGLLLAAVVFVGQAWLWTATTVHYHDGSWACEIIEAVGAGNEDAPVGARGMLLSAALQVTFLVTVLGLGAASAWTLTRIFLPRWGVVAGVGAAFCVAVLLVTLGFGTGGPVDAEGRCAFAPPGLFFSLEPYRFAVLEAVYPAPVVQLHRSLSGVVWSMLHPVNGLAWVALLAVPFSRGVRWSRPGLVERFSHLRRMLFWSSAVQSLINLNHLAALGWMAEIATRVGVDGPVRDLQFGVTIYFGITNSLLLVLLYAPISYVLSCDARELARKQRPGESPVSRDQWRAEHNLVVLQQGPLLRALVFAAPFVVGALVSALESAFGGGGP